MERLLRVSLCLLACFGKTFGDVIEGIKEGSDVILNCSQPGMVKVFDWKKDDQEVFFYEDGKHYNKGKIGQDENFKNRVEFFEDKLQSGNASIRIKNLKVTDSGNYSCGFPNPKVVHHKLVVEWILKDRTGENTNGAVAKPLAKTLIPERHWALLRCTVLHASPKPSVVWYDSADKEIPHEKPEESEKAGYYDITLNANVTKAGIYTCVAKQATLRHQAKDTASVYIAGSSNRTEGKKTIIVSILLLLVVLDLLLP